jgi:hypothetical protein
MRPVIKKLIKNMKNIIIALLAAITVVFSIFMLNTRDVVQPTIQALPNMHARFLASSTVAVGPQQVKTLFTSKELCASRVITTVASGIMLSFDSTLTPTGAVGALQAASTTIAYDSALYGCGAITAYGFASTTITVNEFTF